MHLSELTVFSITAGFVLSGKLISRFDNNFADCHFYLFTKLKSPRLSAPEVQVVGKA